MELHLPLSLHPFLFPPGFARTQPEKIPYFLRGRLFCSGRTRAKKVESFVLIPSHPFICHAAGGVVVTIAHSYSPTPLPRPPILNGADRRRWGKEKMREILKIPSSFVRLWDGGWVECLCVRSSVAGGGGGDDDNDTDGEESLQGEEGGFQRHQTNSQFFSSSFPGREEKRHFPPSSSSPASDSSQSLKILSNFRSKGEEKRGRRSKEEEGFLSDVP